MLTQAAHSLTKSQLCVFVCVVHAYIVCDSDEYFFNYIDTKIMPEMGAPAEISSREFLQITNAQGTGYARSTQAELEFIMSVARTTGVLMDPVYSGKALYHLIRELNEDPAVRFSTPSCAEWLAGDCKILTLVRL